VRANHPSFSPNLHAPLDEEQGEKLDPDFMEREVRRILTPYKILIGNPSNQYANLLSALVSGQDDIQLLHICQTAQELQDKIALHEGDLMLISVSKLLDGPINNLIRSLQKQDRQVQTIMILEQGKSTLGFKEIIHDATTHIIDESSIGKGGLYRCLQALERHEMFIDPIALDRLDQDDNNIEALTLREQDVLQLVAEGLSNREIAESLQIADVTARDHVNKMMHKLGAKDRTQAAVIALRMGLIE